uniref:Vesicle-fusing ATPase n=1 Tax=Rhabditophanes sp. KR3021 TaxID=114890 RepID=A0AC35TH86_9BILA
MSELRLQVAKIPSNELALTNCVIVHQHVLDEKICRHVKVNGYLCSVRNSGQVKPGLIAMAAPTRKWGAFTLEQVVKVEPFSISAGNIIQSITFEVDFNAKRDIISTPFDTDAMASQFKDLYAGQAFTVGQLLVMECKTPEGKAVTLCLVVVSINAADPKRIAAGSADAFVSVNFGQIVGGSFIVFDKKEGAPINLAGKSKGKVAYKSIINTDWSFEKIGIGGLDTQFTSIFRRAFFSRLFSPDQIEELGMKHVRGLLLYGPPGTGKTLIARQIGKMLNSKEPKIVNGPEILDKYVGESEANVRKLFADAEAEWKTSGHNSSLHIIIFDEIDAICKQRGSQAGSSSVHDTVVNQLLSKMDGVDQLNNVLIIGMTNRRDMIDEALLRPGRMEVQMEIALPDEHGRVQILNIHTDKLKKHNLLEKDVNIEDIAKKAKNFSGAELEGLVRAAQSSAMNKLVTMGDKVTVDRDGLEKLRVCADDFEHALKYDIKPAFGTEDDMLEKFLYGDIIFWSEEIQRILKHCSCGVEVARDPESRGSVKILLKGQTGTGKTRLVAEIAKRSGFPYIKVCSPGKLQGMSELAKCQSIKKIFQDAYKSPLSIIIIDDIDKLLGYAAIGPRFSNDVLQSLLVNLTEPPPKDKKLLILATSSSRDYLQELDVYSSFDTVITVPSIKTVSHVIHVVEEADVFDKSAVRYIIDQLKAVENTINIGVRKLLSVIEDVKKIDEADRTDALIEGINDVSLGF